MSQILIGFIMLLILKLSMDSFNGLHHVIKDQRDAGTYKQYGLVELYDNLLLFMNGIR